jgi:hypothetical protein
MNIAVSGSHRTGKTTLIGELAGMLPTFSAVDEPYYLLQEEGYVFADPPSVEDFVEQLERLVALLLGSEGECLFDRCPADMMAYLVAQGEAAASGIDGYPGVGEAMRLLDLVVFVPIEDPDRVMGSDSDLSSSRRRVDSELREIVLEDRWGWGVPALEVTGSAEARARRVAEYLERQAAPRSETRTQG